MSITVAHPTVLPGREAAQPQQRRPGFFEMLGQGLGTGIGEGIQSETQQMMKQSVVDRALKGLPDNPSTAQLMNVAAQLPEELQKPFLTLSQQQMKQQQPDTKSGVRKEEVFSNFVKKTLGNNPSEEAVADAQEISNIGAELLANGLSPLNAYNQSKKVVDIRKKDKATLLEKLSGPSAMFGSKNKVEKDKKLVETIRDRGSVPEEEIHDILLRKGYTEEQIDQYFAPGKKRLTPKEIKKFMELAKGDPELATQLAQSEGFEID